MYTTNPLEAAKVETGITLAEFNNMNLKEIANYFVNYSLIKVFCSKLHKVRVSRDIHLPSDEDIITLDDHEQIKQDLLTYMRLPTTAPDKSSQDVKKRFSKFASYKPRRLSITLLVLRNKLASVDMEAKEI
jgi:hypothetical protein